VVLDRARQERVDLVPQVGERDALQARRHKGGDGEGGAEDEEGPAGVDHAFGGLQADYEQEEGGFGQAQGDEVEYLGGEANLYYSHEGFSGATCALGRADSWRMVFTF
jgi:hypothetical protein